MRIALAQIRSNKGDIQSNISRHLEWIEKAYNKQAELIVFPELSLSGYEPSLASELAMHSGDKRLQLFKECSIKYNMTIAIGVPLRSDKGIYISLLFFLPSGKSKVYSKQILHEDEKSFFIGSDHEMMLDTKTCRIAPAICYESLQPLHLRKAKNNEADTYIVSAAKPLKGMNEAYNYFPIAAKEHNINILLVNAVGPSDDFISSGMSAVWNKNGECVQYLGQDEEALLIYES